MTRRFLVAALAVAAGLVGVGLLAAMGENDPFDRERFLTVGEVLEHPRALYGRTVEVQGQVSRVLGATTVTLAEARGGRELLVFHVDAVPALDDVGDGDRTPSGDLVRVEGRLRPLHHSDFERTLGELDRSRYMAFEGRPAMIADVVNPGYR